MEPQASIKISNYQVKNHISTVKMGDMLVLGMDMRISFVDINSHVCLGEFECDGRVESIGISNDKKEIFVYTN